MSTTAGNMVLNANLPFHMMRSHHHGIHQCFEQQSERREENILYDHKSDIFAS
jgi:hypothetical protein